MTVERYTPNQDQSPRVGSNRFDSRYAQPEHGHPEVPAEVPTRPAEPVKEPEQPQPITLETPVVVPTAPLNAASGDDDLMSQPPPKAATRETLSLNGSSRSNE